MASLLYLLQRVGNLLATLEAQIKPGTPLVLPATLMHRPAAIGAPTAPVPPNIPPQDPQSFLVMQKNPGERIKASEVPKYDGEVEVETWIIDFKKYCRLRSLRSDEDILLAMGIAMRGKAARWWDFAEKKVTSWEEAKGAVLGAYGDRVKQVNCANKLQEYRQESMTIREFFIEVEDLNFYAQLDPETLPAFLEPGLKDELREEMGLLQATHPVGTYEAWKERALEEGSYIDAGKKARRRRKLITRGAGGTPSKPTNKQIPPWPKNKKPVPRKIGVPQAEYSRKTLSKCAKSGHMGKEMQEGVEL